MTSRTGDREGAANGTANVTATGWRSAAVFIALSFAGFISLGLPDGLLGVAWPSIRQTFSLSFDALGPLLIVSTGGYLAASLSSAWIVGRIGIGLLLTASCFATAGSLFGYASAPAWAVMVAFGLLAGFGAGAIDTGLNAYVALRHSRRLMNWLHASYGIGAAAGPAIMTGVLDAGQPWRYGYAIVGGAQVALGLAFLLTASRWQAGTPPHDTPSDAAPVPSGPVEDQLTAVQSTAAQSTAARSTGLRATPHLWQQPAVWIGVSLFFLYTGVELTVGQWSYTVLTEGRGAPADRAGLWISIYWCCLAAGRVLLGLVADRIDPVLLVRGCLAGMLAGVLLFWLAPLTLAFIGLSLIGLTCAPIFPSLIASTPSRHGSAVATTVIGFQVGAAALGVAVVPSLAGVLAEWSGLLTIGPFLAGGCVGLMALHEALVARAR
ncbi:MAG: MFS transporter [Chloroflexi bacterium]|nr:MFS transporter [Chloroflexota bacterium]